MSAKAFTSVKSWVTIKQVILLSTDEEINKKYHKFIKPYLTRSYKIEYDEKLNGSKLLEGYFF